ncbi:Protein sds23 [Penicillium cosmopolitanum]|uniref:Protein SDS23 n=1 Tax=Penicillium cosmopolitanum TaxID=1131564 RepID=A0A9X0BDC9_9EURO|nr:Protein sds23 [Penicillium cosmopolitanum]KAJ5408511.1 Protein sds23 [Penicillium cosmopolitanum]
MSDQPIHREGSDSSLNALANPNNGSEIASPRSSTESRSSSRNHNQLRVSHMPPANHQHRQSLSETLRGPPGSPRSRRQPSLNQSAIQSLIDNPPPPKNVDPAFIGRDWQQISIGELVSPEDLRFVELDTGIEEATNILIDSGTPVLLIRESPDKTSAVATFDYSDLNTYLLLAAGLALPQEHNRASYDELAKKAREGEKIPLKDVKGLGMEKEPLITLPASANVLTAVETFGGGIHRVVVVKESNDQEVVGIFSQFRLVKFLWENGRSFPAIEQLYPQALAQLRIGSHNVISINGDKPLSEALQLMNSEGISSLVVVDNHSNVVGNISTTDVKLLTRSSSLPLLQNTCTHFISVILSTRGLIEGQDSYPVFHVNPTSTLAHTVAKIVATKSHRLWVTDPLSPASSGPPTPSHSSAHIPLAATSSTAVNSSNIGTSPPASPLPPASTSIPAPSQATPHLPTPPHLYGNTESTPSATPPLVPSVPAAALPGARLSGRLVGVVSLTDVLNLHARASGLNPADPAEFRRRRRSSSSSMSVHRSGEVGREMFSRGI